MPGALPADRANCGFHISAAIGSSQAVAVPFRCRGRRRETNANSLARARAHSRSLRAAIEARAGRPLAATSFSEAGPHCRRAASRFSMCGLFSELIGFPSVVGVFTLPVNQDDD